MVVSVDVHVVAPGPNLLKRKLAVYKEGKFGINEATDEFQEKAVPLITSKSFKCARKNGNFIGYRCQRPNWY